MGKKRQPRADQAWDPLAGVAAGTGLLASMVVLERGHILMVREGAGAERGRWNLPGGKLLPGEEAGAGAIRETIEETGYRVEVRHYGGAYPYLSRTGKPRLRLVFFGRVLKGGPRREGDEILDVRWFALEQLCGLPDAELAKPRLLRAILESLPRRGR